MHRCPFPRMMPTVLMKPLMFFPRPVSNALEPKQTWMACKIADFPDPFLPETKFTCFLWDTSRRNRNVGDIPKVDLEVIVAHEVNELDSEQLSCMASVGRNLQVVALNRYTVANANECVSRTCTLRRGAVASPLTTQLYAAFERPS